ncbi:hypothetical protein [Vibrio owensii]|uniref:hypothetical protein n=1 Tax=Vibrio harveyi group TaxID=717610 RepID=UPI003CC65BE2
MNSFFLAARNAHSRNIEILSALHLQQVTDESAEAYKGLPKTLSDIDWNALKSFTGFKKIDGEFCYDLSLAIKGEEERILSIEEASMLRPNLVKVVNVYPDYDSETILYYIKASSKSEAIELLHSYGFNMAGHRIISDYDCTGQWFASSASTYSTKWSKVHKCYVVKMHWARDV